MLVIKQRGSFRNTEKFFKKAKGYNPIKLLEYYGEKGVEELEKATPKDTGLTASSWEYRINRSRGRATISWVNTNIIDGVPIAILLQYGHGTKNGTYVEGIDYVNPAMKPIFERLADEIWKEVIK